MSVEILGLVNVSIQSLVPGLTPGSVLFASPTGGITQNNPQLFWDTTNNALAIGTNVPGGALQKLRIVEPGEVFAIIEGTSPGINVGLLIKNDTLPKQWRLGVAADGHLLIRDDTLGVEVIQAGISPTNPLRVTGVPIFANNAAAIAGGLTAGCFYRSGADPDVLSIVH